MSGIPTDHHQPPPDDDDLPDRIHARVVTSPRGNVAAVAWNDEMETYACPAEGVLVVKRGNSVESFNPQT